MGYRELPDGKLNEKKDVDDTAEKATAILMDVRTNTPVGYAENPELRREVEDKLYEATLMTEYVGMAARTLNSDSAMRKFKDLNQLETYVNCDFKLGRLPRPENDPTGLPGQDPDLADEEDYTAEGYEDDE